MKFDKYMSYLKENSDLSKGIHVSDHIKVTHEIFEGLCSYTIEDSPEYESSKSMIFTVDLKLGNLGKNVITYPDAISNSPEGLKKLSRSVNGLKASLKEAAIRFSEELNKSFETNGFALVNKSDLSKIAKDPESAKAHADADDELGEI
jgi:hypothetical protein